MRFFFFSRWNRISRETPKGRRGGGMINGLFTHAAHTAGWYYFKFKQIPFLCPKDTGCVCVCEISAETWENMSTCWQFMSCTEAGKLPGRNYQEFQDVAGARAPTSWSGSAGMTKSPNPRWPGHTPPHRLCLETSRPDFSLQVLGAVGHSAAPPTSTHTPHTPRNSHSGSAST